MLILRCCKLGYSSNLTPEPFTSKTDTRRVGRASLYEAHGLCPSCGIWQVRSENVLWVHSKLTVSPRGSCCVDFEDDRKATPYIKQAEHLNMAGWTYGTRKRTSLSISPIGSDVVYSIFQFNMPICYMPIPASATSTTDCRSSFTSFSSPSLFVDQHKHKLFSPIWWCRLLYPRFWPCLPSSLPCSLVSTHYTSIAAPCKWVSGTAEEKRWETKLDRM